MNPDHCFVAALGVSGEQDSREKEMEENMEEAILYYLWTYKISTSKDRNINIKLIVGKKECIDCKLNKETRHKFPCKEQDNDMVLEEKWQKNLNPLLHSGIHGGYFIIRLWMSITAKQIEIFKLSKDPVLCICMNL